MKLIHTADVHLGASPDMGYPWEAERSASLWSTFRRLIENVKYEKPDLLLISGDLFHGCPSIDDLQEVNYLFSTIPEVTVVLCAGNHDNLGKSDAYVKFNWAKNVVGLWSRELSSVSILGKDVRVYGLSYYDNEAAVDLYADAARAGNEKYHILLMHGGDAKHSPVKRARLAQMDFDYIAMGHIHKGGYVIKNKALYSGALVPIDRNDTGEHGYIAVQLDENGAHAEFVKFAPYKYDELTIYSDSDDTVLSLEDKIKAAVYEKGENNSYRLTIQGSSKAAGRLSLQSLFEIGHILEINDMTAPLLDLDELCVKYKGTLAEEYILALQDRDDEVSRYALNEGIGVILQAMGCEEAAYDNK